VELSACNWSKLKLLDLSQSYIYLALLDRSIIQNYAKTQICPDRIIEYQAKRTNRGHHDINRQYTVLPVVGGESDTNRRRAHLQMFSTSVFQIYMPCTLQFHSQILSTFRRCLRKTFKLPWLSFLNSEAMAPQIRILKHLLPYLIFFSTDIESNFCNRIQKL